MLLCHRPVDTAGIAKAYLKRPSTEEPFVRIGEKQCEAIEGLEACGCAFLGLLAYLSRTETWRKAHQKEELAR